VEGRDRGPEPANHGAIHIQTVSSPLHSTPGPALLLLLLLLFLNGIFSCHLTTLLPLVLIIIIILINVVVVIIISGTRGTVKVVSLFRSGDELGSTLMPFG